MTQPAAPDVAKLIQKALVVMHPGLRQFTYPLFAVDEHDRPELFASSVLIEVDGRTVLITAAHAISEILGVESRVHVGLDGGIETLPPFILSSHGGADPYDLAAVEITGEMAHRFRKPLPLAQTSVVGDPHMRVIHGFPVTKNTLRKSVDEIAKKFSAHAFTYAGASKGLEDRYAQFGKDPAIHIALQYEKKGRNDGGDIVHPPHPRGISGGGLWQVPDVYRPNEVRLEGIAFEYHKTGPLVFATRIEYVVTFVRQYVLADKAGPEAAESDA